MTKSLKILKFDEPDADGDVFLKGCIKTKNSKTIILNNFDEKDPVGYMENIVETEDGWLIGEPVFLESKKEELGDPENLSLGIGGDFKDVTFPLHNPLAKTKKLRYIKNVILWYIGIRKKADKKQVTIYAHGSKESNYDFGIECGLTGKALDMFKFALYEIKCECEVDMNTGIVEILKVNDRKLESKCQIPNHNDLDSQRLEDKQCCLTKKKYQKTKKS